MYTDNEEFLEDFADALDDYILPSGSGINSDWDISYSNDARTISCSNAYDHMNEVGFYDATIPFKVDIPVEDPLGFSLTFTGDDMNQAFAEEDDLGSYLEDVIAYSLDNYAKEIKAYADEVGQRGIDVRRQRFRQQPGNCLFDLQDGVARGLADGFLGARGIWLAVPASDLVALAVSLSCLRGEAMSILGTYAHRYPRLFARTREGNAET